MKVILISAMWCPACIIVKQNLAKVMQEYPMWQLEEYDYDFDEEIVEQYQVGDLLPVIILCKGNQEIKRIAKEVSYKELKEVFANEI